MLARRSAVVFLALERSAVVFVAVLGIVHLPGVASWNIARARKSAGDHHAGTLSNAGSRRKEADAACCSVRRGQGAEHRKAWASYRHVEPELKSAVGVKLTLIPAGEFRWERRQQLNHACDPNFDKETADQDKPQHRVRIARPFYIGTCEVTKGQFRKFVDDRNYVTDAEKDRTGGVGLTGKEKAVEALDFDPKFTWRDWGLAQGDEEPVINVSHNDAWAFCDWLRKKGRKAVPSADRGGMGICLPSGNDGLVLLRRRSRGSGQDRERGGRGRAREVSYVGLYDCLVRRVAVYGSGGQASRPTISACMT